MVLFASSFYSLLTFYFCVVHILSIVVLIIYGLFQPTIYPNDLCSYKYNSVIYDSSGKPSLSHQLFRIKFQYPRVNYYQAPTGPFNNKRKCQQPCTCEFAEIRQKSHQTPTHQRCNTPVNFYFRYSTLYLLHY